MVKLVTLVFNTNHMKEMVAFYEAGLPGASEFEFIRHRQR
jgi:hypothetical protein